MISITQHSHSIILCIKSIGLQKPLEPSLPLCHTQLMKAFLGEKKTRKMNSVECLTGVWGGANALGFNSSLLKMSIPPTKDQSKHHTSLHPSIFHADACR